MKHRLNTFTMYLITFILISLWTALDTQAAQSKASPPLPKPTLEAQCGLPFQDNAILQQKLPLPVWGTSLAGAKVTLSFNGQTKTATADKDGKWRVVLDPMDGVKLKTVNDSPAGETMTITCERDDKKAVKQIKNVILGDVWLCAGQSNIAGAIKTRRDRHYPADTLEKENYPALRQLSGNTWLVCSTDTAPSFKKVAFFFARRLQRDALVPIGLIPAVHPGSKIESWLNQKPYATGVYHSRLIVPLLGYGIRGALWYQGESNGSDGRLYQPKLESLITGWRKAWGQGGFPVHFVQLPGIGGSSLDNPAGGNGRSEIRQSCVEALALKNTGLAVTIDVGTSREHPPNKYDTGVRLARSVLQKVYGFKDITACQLYTKHAIEGSTIRISFTGALVAYPLPSNLPTCSPWRTSQLSKTFHVSAFRLVPSPFGLGRSDDAGNPQTE